MFIKHKSTRVVASLLVAGALTTTKAFAQLQPPANEPNLWHFELSAAQGVLTGSNIRYYYHFSTDVRAKVAYSLNPKVALTLSAGYIHLYPRDYMAGPLNIHPKADNYIPVNLGVKAFLTPHFYVSGEAGVAFETGDWTRSSGSNKTWINWAPGVGYAVGHSGLNISLRYEDYIGTQTDHFGIVALRIAYRF